MIGRSLTLGLVVVFSALVFLPRTMAATAPSGQVAFGQSTVEAAYDYATGDLIYLLTPDHVPFPSKANSVATAPMYLPMYPSSSTIPTLNCRPTNCDHLNVVPQGLVDALQLGSVYPSGTIETKYGTFTGGLYAGHDHLVGVASTGGDFNVAWHVYLIVFTPQAVTDGAINQEITTTQQMWTAIAAGDAIGPIDSGITFNCSVVSPAVYWQHAG